MNRASHVAALLLTAATLQTSASFAQSTPPAAGAPGAPAATAVDDALGTRGRDRWYLQTSLYTRHFHPTPEHQNHNKLVNLERQRSDDWLGGAAWFLNSFDQPTWYLYIGRQWRPFDSMPNVHVKLTGGLIHGYKDQYKDKIPLNHWGTAPALLPSIGYSGKRFGTEVILFGTAGLMWTAGVFLD